MLHTRHVNIELAIKTFTEQDKLRDLTYTALLVRLLSQSTF